MGTQNPGVQAFLAHDLPRLRKGGVLLIASVAGSSLNEYVNVAGALHLQEGIVGLEVYLSCPDDEREGEPFYGRIERLTEIVGAVARLSRVPVFAKLPAFVGDRGDRAGLRPRGCLRAHVDRRGAGARGRCRAAPDEDRDAGRGLSRPAIKPIALAAVYRVARAMPHVPVLGVGGVTTGEDAIEFLLAGAWAVQVGTAMLVDPSAHVEIARGSQSTSAPRA